MFTNKLKKELPSAGDPIKWVSTCPSNALIVAALTNEGVVKIWYMDEMEQELLDNAIEEGQLCNLRTVENGHDFVAWI